VTEQRELVAGVFLDIEGTCSFDAVCTALCDRGVDSITSRWIRATLEGRLATATLSGVSVRVAVARVARREVCCHRSCGAL
jgi:hypothetical protein